MEERESDLESGTLVPSPLQPQSVEPVNPWPEVVNKNLREAIRAYRESQERREDATRELIGIDKGILLVFAIALLGTLFFTFYMVALGRLDPVTSVLYPIISLILGFMSGYFAGTGRTKGR